MASETIKINVKMISGILGIALVLVTLIVWASSVSAQADRNTKRKEKGSR